MEGLFERVAGLLSDRYELQRALGEGATAQVFLARDLKHGRLVAIKVLRPELAAAIGAERFLREIRVAAQLNHPHVLPLHDSGEADGLLYYVMPHVEGATLGEEARRAGPLSVERALQWGRHIAEALGHAHERGVVHRDVKPDNVLLVEGEAVVADFGLAHSDAVNDLATTQVGATLGTPSYMSPEQARSDVEIDARTDVYSLGCVLFELLAGRPPFKGKSLRDLLNAHAEGPVPSLRAERDDVSAELDALVARAMAKEPEARFADGNAMAAALAQVQRGLHATEERTAGRRRTRRVAVIAALLLVVLAAWLGWTMKQASDQSWIMDEGLPGIEAAADAGEWDEAYALALEVEARDPDNEALAKLWRRFSGEVEVRSDPPGATVVRRSHDDDVWIPVGTTPVTARMPHSVQHMRFELDGHRTAEIASHWYYLRDEPVRLAPEGDIAPDLVFVPGGNVTLNIPGLDHISDVDLGGCAMARHEVTNAEFAEFVRAGGYDDPTHWADAFEQAGVALSWDESRARFVDSTGQTGPATWIAGDHPDGEEQHPVAGVSWFEAMAYASWSGRSLPTVFHWNRAAETRMSQIVSPLSNFQGDATAPVGSFTGTSAFGLADMGGNVREWCLNPTSDGQRAILGGGWNDLPYAFNDFFAQDPWDRSVTNGLRTVEFLEPLDDTVTAVIEPPFRDFLAETPVSDEVFAVYRDLFRYDPLSLESEVELRDDAHESYVVEKVSYTLPYGDERGAAYVYTPKRGPGPFPTVVYFPGSNAIHTDDSSQLLRPWFGFLLKAGYAVLHPIHLGTYERGTELDSDYPAETQLYRDHVIAWGMDQSRAIDYAETRPEFDTSRLAYFGASWGGAMGPVMVATEPRIDTAVLYVAGFCFQRARAEVDTIHYVPRVTVPTLMMNGRYDHYFPLDTSQRPLFELLGCDDDRKRMFLAEGGHSVPRADLIRETLAWLEEWLAPEG